VKYGPLAFYCDEVREALSLLSLLAQRVDGATPAGPQEAAELALGVYYLIVERRNAQGLDPGHTQREHATCKPVDLRDLREIADMLPLASPVAYSTCAADAQRQLKLVEGEWRLVFAETAGPGGRPPFILTVDRRARRAAILVPGTQSPADIVTDLRAVPVRLELGPGRRTGWAHRGALRAACALVNHVGGILEDIERRGYEVFFVGHSLGAAVGALAAAVLRLGVEGPLLSSARVFCYAPPACGDVYLSRFCEAFVISVVNCDDVVPRLSLETARKFRAELEERREAVRTYARQDAEAIKNVRGLVQLKRRTGHGLTASEGVTDVEVQVEPIPSTAFTEGPALSPAVVKPLAAAATAASTAAVQTGGEEKLTTAAKRPAPAVKASRCACLFSRRKQAAEPEESVPTPVPTLAAAEDLEPDPPEDLEPHKVTLYPPGRLVHLYRHCGARRAVWVTRTHPTLHRIEVEQGLWEDHKGETYKFALEEALVAANGSRPPVWKPFSDVGHCELCKEAFGWDSLLRSEPHRLQARHHCNSCGRVVCTSCSQRRRPLPQLGILREARVCDKCFMRAGGGVM